MLHFETIWNEAESVAKSFTDLSRKEILRKLRAAVEDLSDSDSIAEYNFALGEILFCLAAFCAHLDDKKSLVLNSAAALTFAISRKRKEFTHIAAQIEQWEIQRGFEKSRG